MCNCREKVILYEPVFAMEAYEYWCPKHGYQNDCYMCHISDDLCLGTELCLRHRITPMKLCPKHEMEWKRV